MQVINTNIMSLNAQRNLSTSQDMLATSMQRLSTGLRINSAKDDAAGLAISERFTAQIRGLDQAALRGRRGRRLHFDCRLFRGQVPRGLPQEELARRHHRVEK